MAEPNTHIVIPDTQVKPGVDTDHLEWAGRYIGEHFGGRRNVTIVHLGDHWDMPSLSSFDAGKKVMEGRRYEDDIRAGNDGFALLDGSLRESAPKWKPRKVFLFGNHEERIVRAANDNAQFDGKIGLHDCDTLDWERHPFLKPVAIDGVTYAHYFHPPNSPRPYSGTNIETRLKNIGASFTMGHQQGLLVGMRNVLGRMQRGIAAGSFYQHDEEYRGWQQNQHWRGILVCHEVEDGDYSLMEVSMGFLERRHGGKKKVA